MAKNSETTYTDTSRLKGLANPIRAAIYYRLATLSEATATRIASDLDVSPSLASYHLRELSKYGFVNSFTPTSADRRTRWWRVIDRGVLLPAPQNAGEETRHLLAEVETIVVDNQLEQINRFRTSRGSWDPSWIDSAFAADFILRLSAQELSALYQALEAVIRSFEMRSTESAQTANRESAMVIIHGFPIQSGEQ